jgi:hypothetical protein
MDTSEHDWLEQHGRPVAFYTDKAARSKVERSFSTVQDRLVKGFRTAGAKTLEQGNAYLHQELLQGLGPFRANGGTRQFSFLELKVIECVNKGALLNA